MFDQDENVASTDTAVFKSSDLIDPSTSVLQAKFFLGDVGQGANMKLVVNMVMGR